MTRGPRFRPCRRTEIRHDIRYDKNPTMKIPSLLLLSSLSCLATIAFAEKPANLAITPALHPGTEAKHESFNEISKLGEARIVFLGDSITAGWSGKGKAIWEKT